LRTADRQAARMRAMYLRATLRQDVGFFDTAGAGVAEVVNSVSTDTMAIQEAIGEKVGQHSFFFFFFCFFILFFFPTSYFLLHESNKTIQFLNVDDILEFVSRDVGKSR
jgi:ABC-type multidrug transport system fused ATPase/permease subunit